MMFILQKKNNILLLVALFTMCGCRYFFPLEPVASVNKEFLANYKNSVEKAKKKNQKSLEESKYGGVTKIENTAYGKQLRAEQQFLVDNTANNPFPNNNKYTDTEIDYLSSNYGKYNVKDYSMFNDMDIPEDDFKYYDLGEKDYNEISNRELQKTYDYIEIMNKERMKQIEIARIKEDATRAEEAKTSRILDKTKGGLKSLINKVKGLLD